MRKSVLFLLLLAVILSLIIGCGGKSEEEKFYEKVNKGLENTYGAEAQTRTCQANLRTLDGVINAYYADTGKYPGTIEETFKAGYLKKVPTCPSGDLSYELRGDPPEAYCPNDPSHKL